MVTGEQVCLGIDWSDVDSTPRLRLATVGSHRPSFLVPLDTPMRFKVLAADRRYCSGWFDLTGADPRHVICETWEQAEAGRQCARCRYREGFLSAHQAHASPAALAENVRDYLARPHLLYLDVFADGSTKVGTVAQTRLASRVAEQGAVAACYVARAANGTDIRRVEGCGPGFQPWPPGSFLHWPTLPAAGTGWSRSTHPIAG